MSLRKTHTTTKTPNVVLKATFIRESHNRDAQGLLNTLIHWPHETTTVWSLKMSAKSDSLSSSVQNTKWCVGGQTKSKKPTTLGWPKVYPKISHLWNPFKPKILSVCQWRQWSASMILLWTLILMSMANKCLYTNFPWFLKKKIRTLNKMYVGSNFLKVIQPPVENWKCAHLLLYCSWV